MLQIFEQIIKMIVNRFDFAATIIGRNIKRTAVLVLNIFLCLLTFFAAVVVIVLCQIIFDPINMTIIFWIIVASCLLSFMSRKTRWGSAVLGVFLAFVVVLHIANSYVPGFSSMINSQKESVDNDAFHNFVPATESEERIINTYKKEEVLVLERVDEANNRFDYQEALRIMEEYIEKGNGLKKELLRIRSSALAGNNVEEMIEMKGIDAIYLNQTNLGRINKPGLVKFYAPKPFQLVCSVVGQGGATLVNKPAGYSDQYFSSPGLILIHGSDRYDVQAEIP